MNQTFNNDFYSVKYDFYSIFLRYYTLLYYTTSSHDTF